MSKIGFEMKDEERVLKVLDTVMGVSLAQLVEGFAESVLERDESKELTDLLIKAGGITGKALERYKRKE